jgi:hypothetical protein
MACDPGLVCYDPLCFRPNAASAGGHGGRGGKGGANAGAPSGGTNAGTDGGGSPGSGGATGPDGSMGGSGNAGAGGATSSATCPFPKDGLITPVEQTDLLKTSKDKIDAKFTSGVLVELDSKTCTVDPSPAKLEGDWSTYLCHDAYLCGGCPVFVVSPHDATSVGQWFVLGVYTATGTKTLGCPELSGGYNICAPDCSGKECGDDGCGSVCGSCGQGRCCKDAQNKCLDDPCMQCVDACTDACSGSPDPSCFSSCCMGTGCQCESSCPSPC